jgi:hypothetical protein
VDELTVDAMGNVIAIKRGASAKAARVMLAAHMDEIGFMVRCIDDHGFVRIQPLGGLDPRVLLAQRAIVHTRSGERLRGVLTPATKPIHLLGDEQPGALKLEDFYLDLGLPGERVKELVSLGDSITLDRTFERVGENVIGKAMDDRTGVFTMIEALRFLCERLRDGQPPQALMLALQGVLKALRLPAPARGGAVAGVLEQAARLPLKLADDIAGEPVLWHRAHIRLLGHERQRRGNQPELGYDRLRLQGDQRATSSQAVG